MKSKLLIIIASIAVILSLGIIYWGVMKVVAHKPKRIEKVKYGKEAVAPKPELKRAAPLIPPAAKRYKNPKIAIVIDDFGYSMTNINGFLNIKKPLTFSILPNLKYSGKIAKTAIENGDEVILHLPLEPHRKDIREEVNTINSRMSEKEVISALDTAIKSVPGLKGVSNHEGSKATEEGPLMTIILTNLNKKGLYFFDSVTSNKSVVLSVAKATGTRCARRNVFLDNDNGIESIKKQILILEKFAFKNGRATAIGHDRKNTVKALAEMMPQMSDEGVEFVLLSDMVK